jgi:hypothetical protein
MNINSFYLIYAKLSILNTRSSLYLSDNRPKFQLLCQPLPSQKSGYFYL